MPAAKERRAPVRPPAQRLWFDGYDTAYTVGIGNVNFSIGVVTTTPVPEPETYAMLLAGQRLLGPARRRKQASAS